MEREDHGFAIEGGDIVGQAVNRMAVKEQNRAGSALRRNETIFGYQAAHDFIRECVFEIRGQVVNPTRTALVSRLDLAGERFVVRERINCSFGVRAWNQIKWAIELIYLVQKDDRI